MLVFMLMPLGMELIGGNAVTMAEMRRLFGAGVLDVPGYSVLVVVVIVIAALCMLTSRFGVYSILETQR
jgi:cell division transport system permease protein